MTLGFPAAGCLGRTQWTKEECRLWSDLRRPRVG